MSVPYDYMPELKRIPAVSATLIHPRYYSDAQRMNLISIQSFQRYWHAGEGR